jgi:hypothetical protein
VSLQSIGCSTARKAAERSDVDDVYGRPTGAPVTDGLFEEIREQERSHASTVKDLRHESRDSSAPSDGRDAAGATQARTRLDRILARERWRQRGGGWISDAIYGANDGLASVFAMSIGAFLAARSEAEVVAANVERERQEIVEHSEEEQEELSLLPGQGDRRGHR